MWGFPCFYVNFRERDHRTTVESTTASMGLAPISRVGFLNKLQHTDTHYSYHNKYATLLCKSYHDWLHGWWLVDYNNIWRLDSKPPWLPSSSTEYARKAVWLRETISLLIPIALRRQNLMQGHRNPLLGCQHKVQ